MAKSFVCLLVLIGLLLSGCATIGTGSSQRSVEKGISLINSGDVATLMEHTAIPFVFDGEILIRSGDVRILWENLSNNDFVIVDGSRGKIYVNPDEQTIEKFREEKKRLEIVRQSLKELKDLPAVTLDGFRIGRILLN